MYWDINETLSYNALMNFIVGNRGGGKTYGFKRWAVADFIKTGRQFVYLRRYKTELTEFSRYFDDLKANGEFADHELIIKGKKALIDGKEAGFAIALTTGITKKSTSMPRVNKMCYDEFMLERGSYHYLPDEVNKFLGLYDSIFRMRDGIVFFLSNAITITNPYFIYFDLSLPQNQKKIRAKNDILVQLVEDADFIQARSATRFGKIISGTSYGDYAIDNQFSADNDTFVMKKTDNAKYFATLHYCGEDFGVWADYYNSLMFITKRADKHYPVQFAFTTDDHKPNILLLRNRRNRYLQMIYEAYEYGIMRFDCINTKNRFMEIYKLSKS